MAKPMISGYGENTLPAPVYCKVTGQGEEEDDSRSQYKQNSFTKVKTEIFI